GSKTVAARSMQQPRADVTPLTSGADRAERGGLHVKAGTAARHEVAQQVVAMAGEDRLRMELHALDVEFAMAQPHDLVDRTVGVFGPRGDLEASRQRLALDHQRVVTR